MKSNSNVRPLTFEKVGNGSWWYRYNIQEREVEDPETKEKSVVYDYDEVQVWEKPNDNNLKAAVIADKYTLSEEINLANNYRRFELGMTTDEAKKTGYINYLKDVDALKAMVEKDLVDHAGELE